MEEIPKTKRPGYRTELEKNRRKQNPDKVREETRLYYSNSENAARRRLQAKTRWHTVPGVKEHSNNYKAGLYKKNKTKDPVGYMVYSSRARAKQKNIEHTITKEDLLPMPEFCPVLGLRLNYFNFYNGMKMPPETATTDRIDSTKGYIPGNVEIVSWRANKLKQDATREEMIALYRYYIEGNILK